MDSNTYAFIDAQNLYMGVKKMGWNLDYERFRIYLEEQFNITKAFLFIGYVPSNAKLYNSLQKYGYILIFKPIIRSCYNKIDHIKGNVDAELVLHTMIEYENYDNAMIVSSDGDFHCLIEYLHRKNKLRGIITTHRKYSSLLRKFAKSILPIECIRKKVEMTISHPE